MMHFLCGYAAAALFMFVLSLGLCLMDKELRREERLWLLIVASILAGAFWPLIIGYGAWRDFRGKT